MMTNYQATQQTARNYQFPDQTAQDFRSSSSQANGYEYAGASIIHGIEGYNMELPDFEKVEIDWDLSLADIDDGREG